MPLLLIKNPVKNATQKQEVSFKVFVKAPLRPNKNAVEIFFPSSVEL